MPDYFYGGSTTRTNGDDSPVYPTIDPYKTPEWDWSRIAALQQEQMAPGLSKLRRGLQNISSQYYANPAERAMAYREAMGGYGEGLGGIQAGGQRAALGLYSPQYQSQLEQAKINWQTKQQESINKYQSDVEKWRLEQEEKKNQQAINDYYDKLVAGGQATKNPFTGKYTLTPQAQQANVTYQAAPRMIAGTTTTTPSHRGEEGLRWWERPATTQTANYARQLEDIEGEVTGGKKPPKANWGKMTYYDPETGLTFDENGLIVA